MPLEKSRAHWIPGDILDIKTGYIMQQVNCKNAYGRGISGQISAKYPKVLEDYKYSFTINTGEELFSTMRYIPVTPTLVVINSYSQFDYGNAARTGICYTDMDKLVTNINIAVGNVEPYQLYIPFRIGCGLAGGNWDKLYSIIKDYELNIVYKEGV